jgi:hypothetical protein
MKGDEIPATTKEYWESKKMKRKKKMPVDREMSPGMEAQMDPQIMEQMAAMRGNPNLRPMGKKRTMRPVKANAGARLSRMR